ncbi:MAG TPA: AbrB/MazE/SpoVT family DNA-binding domain-containing protein [Candidatus Yonathbacteria bacterium]|nr:AbrB/MazE/SpoVT family DNA-binding domain-containing protein [Candidatus Yonathbacteria bacterium]
MTQKVLKVGSSAAVTIPKKSMEELGLKIGDKVTVDVNKETNSVVIAPQRKLSAEDQKIARLTLNFINRYRKDIESLAHR